MKNVSNTFGFLLMPQIITDLIIIICVMPVMMNAKEGAKEKFILKRIKAYHHQFKTTNNETIRNIKKARSFTCNSKY